jgi:hypothetical protein
MGVEWDVFLDLARQLDAMPELFTFSLPLFEPRPDTSGGEYAVERSRKPGPMHDKICLSIYQCRIRDDESRGNLEFNGEIRRENWRDLEFKLSRVVVYHQYEKDVASRGFVSRWVFVAHDNLAHLIDSPTTGKSYLDTEISGYAFILSVMLGCWSLLLNSIEDELGEASTSPIYKIAI